MTHAPTLLTPPEDDYFMALALEQAKLGAQMGEVPVGAVLVFEGRVLARAFNQPIHLSDPTAHAEIQVLRLAGGLVNNYRLPGSTLYVTLEPCPMCVGAILHARVAKVVFGTPDAKTGAAGSVCNLFEEKKLNHHAAVMGGVLKEPCKQVLQAFFQARRVEKKRSSRF